jgi:hypothetical protein
MSLVETLASIVDRGQIGQAVTEKGIGTGSGIQGGGESSVAGAPLRRPQPFFFSSSAQRA